MKKSSLYLVLICLFLNSCTKEAPGTIISILAGPTDDREHVDPIPEGRSNLNIKWEQNILTNGSPCENNFPNYNNVNELFEVNVGTVFSPWYFSYIFKNDEFLQQQNDLLFGVDLDQFYLIDVTEKKFIWNKPATNSFQHHFISRFQNYIFIPRLVGATSKPISTVSSFDLSTKEWVDIITIGIVDDWVPNVRSIHSFYKEDGDLMLIFDVNSYRNNEKKCDTYLYNYSQRQIVKITSKAEEWSQATYYKDGKYFRLVENSLMCLDATTGDEFWETQLSFAGWMNNEKNFMEVQNGIVIVNPQQGDRMYGLDAENGYTKWSKKLAPRGPQADEVMIANEKIYFISDGALHSMDIHTGDIIFKEYSPNYFIHGLGARFTGNIVYNPNKNEIMLNDHYITLGIEP